jgi:hypothetical protein
VYSFSNNEWQKMTSKYIYQIFYNQESEKIIDAGFIPMNNSENLRPDWREYWPIRHFLLSQPIESNAYYGFFSPKFHAKTLLTSADVYAFLKDQTADVISFSPYFDQIAFFPNPFIQGEISHPGLLSISQSYCNQFKINIDLQHMICDQYTTIYSNFFVAKGKFWLRWIDYCETLFQFCEENKDSISIQLNSLTRYKINEQVAMKVFLMERMATLILNVEKFTTNCINNITLPYAGDFLIPHHRGMVRCEALKQSYLRSGNPIFLDFFHQEAKAIAEEATRDIKVINQ